MTAFGRTALEEDDYSLTVEIRTLNSRFLDIVLKLPKQLMEFEDGLRKQVSRSARRGRVEVFVQTECRDPGRLAPNISLPLASLYWEQLLELHHHLPGSDPPKLEHLLTIPNIFEPSHKDDDREIMGKLLSQAATEALRQIDIMKRGEGEALAVDLTERLAALREDIRLIDGRKETVLEEYKNRLRERMIRLLEQTDFDEARLLQETAYFAERSDINEEIVRFNSHLDQFHDLIASGEAADGRRLDFLSQELHREANTIGSKTGDIETVRAVVRMKTEIGKLKEQIQNVE